LELLQEEIQASWGTHADAQIWARAGRVNTKGLHLVINLTEKRGCSKNRMSGRKMRSVMVTCKKAAGGDQFRRMVRSPRYQDKETKMLVSQTVIIALMLAAFASPAWAQLDKVLKGLGGSLGSGGGLSDAKIGSGLQEALKVGTENAVLQTGAMDGFFKNKAIKILMPKPLQTIEQPLRLVGYGPQVDELVLKMNRAAEKAVPFAKQIFWDAIGQMTFDDARRILNGGDTAATEYFERKTSGKLHSAFKPTVEKVMHDVGVTKQYNELIGRYKSVPFAQSITFDINRYVTERTTDGLFLVVG
jgi:hypothetical protein